jgi:hypothetical protein
MRTTTPAPLRFQKHALDERGLTVCVGAHYLAILYQSRRFTLVIVAGQFL